MPKICGKVSLGERPLSRIFHNWLPGGGNVVDNAETTTTTPLLFKQQNYTIAANPMDESVIMYYVGCDGLWCGYYIGFWILDFGFWFLVVLESGTE